MNTANGFTALPSFALLEVSGPDSERFLQGQLTCDVNSLENNHWTLGACCTAKGRMVANFVIARIDDAFWLRLPYEQVSLLQQHLSKYAVFFKASMLEHNADWQISGSIKHIQAPQLLEQPQPLNIEDERICLNWPDGRQECWQAGQNQDAETNSDWLLADIQQGLVWVTAASTEQWVPQSIDWHQQGGVSFNKGCYTGQEIVARLQYLGKSKKQLVKISSTTALGLELLSSLHNNEGQACAEVVAWHQNQGLAIINQEHQGGLLSNLDDELSFSPLFYA